MIDGASARRDKISTVAGDAVATWVATPESARKGLKLSPVRRPRAGLSLVYSQGLTLGNTARLNPYMFNRL